ncbi:MAG: Rrf2 family transcriptional regulator [Gemmataceae bacterium]|nr:Rrf2 family transcriptional regulator [Gemmataceae bacterium]
MTLLNRKVDYALLILSYLHHTREGGCARAIAGRFGLSRPFVANILKRLCQKGFVASHRGVRGGYQLEPGSHGRNLADLMHALDEPFHLAACNRDAGDACCIAFGNCPVKGAVAEVHRRLCGVLEGVTLGEVFGQAPAAMELLELETSRCTRGALVSR